jgi:uncharacterized membrane protein
MGKMLILLGIILVLLGIGMTLFDKIPWLGRLPGDIAYEGKKIHFYFPLTTCIILSLIITLIMWLLGRR